MRFHIDNIATATKRSYITEFKPKPSAVLALQPPQSGTHYPLASVVLPLQTLSVASLKLTASSRPTAPPSGSAKCLRFGYWLTLCTLNILCTYLLTYLFITPELTAGTDHEYNCTTVWDTNHISIDKIATRRRYVWTTWLSDFAVSFKCKFFIILHCET